MHFIILDICNQNECLISVTLHWLKYITCTRPNGATLYTEKSQTFKNDCNPFLLFISHNEQLKNHCWPSAKSMTLNFVDVVSVLPPIFCQVDSSMPYIFVVEFVALLGAMAEKWV